jgi:hypothetical protein
MSDDMLKTLSFFGKLDGVVQARILSNSEKKLLTEIESRNEEKKFMGMCRTHNKAARDGMSRKHTLALIIKGGQFKAIPFPRMKMMYKGELVGEELYEKDRIEELKKDSKNLFLWENFVMFMRKMPKDRSEYDRVVIIHTPSKHIPQDLSMFENLVMGEPCGESDLVIKEWFGFKPQEGIFGTILIGFDNIVA